MKKPVFTPSEMRTFEGRAIAQGYPSLLLMEHAACATVDVLIDQLRGCVGKRVLFLCGKGNNGGDGYAAARIFRDRGGEAVIWQLDEPATEDAKTNALLCRMKEIMIIPATKEMVEDMPMDPGLDAVVDAIYGTGFHGECDAVTKTVIRYVNDLPSAVPVIAIDIPSGMEGESGSAKGEHIQADVTVTFHAAKPGLYLTEDREAVGEIVIADIGLNALDEEMVPLLEATLYRVVPQELCYLPQRRKNAHKGDAGRVLIYAGSLGMAGAAAMCAEACLTAGAGLVTIVAEKELIPILQVLVPCAMCVDIDEAIQSVPKYDVLALGCGLKKGERQWQNILKLWDAEKPSVWDADALNMLSEHPMDLGELAVITPHIGEAARLLKCTAEEINKDRPDAVRKLQKRYGCTAVLKSDVPLIADDCSLTLVACGTPALSKGGSGDVLCGIITALLAQQASNAAMLGTLWHACASRVGEKRYGQLEMTAKQLISCLAEAEKVK